MLDFFGFLAGQLKERRFLRWFVQNWQEIVKVWTWTAGLLTCVIFIAAFALAVFFGTKSLHWMPGETALRMIFFGPGFLTQIFGVGVLFAQVFVFPLLLVLVPFLVVAAPVALAAAGVFGVAAVVVLVALVVLSPLIIIFGGRALLMSALAWWLRHADQREREEHAVKAALGLEEHTLRSIDGKARLMDAEEFKRLKLPTRGAVIRAGRFAGDWFDFHTEKHALIVASTRGGKGRDLIIPNLCGYSGSVFCLDPKGENAAQTHRARAQYGPVQVLDPFGVSGLPSARFNPLALIRGDMQIIAAQMLADALVIGRGDHWTGAAKELLTGLMLHVVTSPDIPKKTLPEVRRLLMRDMADTLKQMVANIHGPSLVQDIGEWGQKTEPREWSGVVSTAIEQTRWLSAPQIQAVLEDGGEQINFDLFRTETGSVFVCLPAPYFSTFSQWLRLVVSSGLDALTKQLNPDMPLPTRFVLDEIAQLGHLEKIESALTLSAGYGVQLWGIWQHLKDIERCYPKSGVAGWVSSSGVRLVFATQDNETVRYFAGMTGDAMSETDIRHLGPGEMLCLLDGQNPMIIDRVPGPG